MTRITYVKNDEGNVLTTKELVARDKVVNANILIKEDGYHYIVTNLGNGMVLANGVVNTMPKAKKAVKDSFKALGMVISDEVRKKV